MSASGFGSGEPKHGLLGYIYAEQNVEFARFVSLISLGDTYVVRSASPTVF